MNVVRRLLASLASVLTLSPAQAQKEMVSWVVLSNTPLELAAESLRATLEQLYPGNFQPGEQANFVLDGPVPGAQFLVQSNVSDATGLFMIQNVPGPYTDFANFAARIADAKMRAEALAQQAWLSVDKSGYTRAARTLTGSSAACSPDWRRRTRHFSCIRQGSPPFALMTTSAGGSRAASRFRELVARIEQRQR